MVGHSKWSEVKHIEGPLEVKRGAQFSRLVKETTVAPRLGGGDLGGNPRLRSVAETACAANIPKDNIESAVKKGARKIEGTHHEEIFYEAYASGGMAMIIEDAADNKNRPAADLRLIFSKNSGSLAASGSVLYMFRKKEQLTARPYAVADALRTRGIEADLQEHTYLPGNTVTVGDGAVAVQVLRLHETLEDHDDTQNVYSNFDIPEEVLARLPA